MLDEAAVRCATLERLSRSWPSDDHTMIVEEFGTHFGDNRIDVAVVNGALRGYEIKSTRDRLTRLPDQVTAFSEVFDYATVVVAERHLDAAMGLIPDWWGVIEARDARGGTGLTERRRGRRNQTLVPVAVARLLWRDELLIALEAIGADVGIRSRGRPELASRLAESLPLDELRCVVRHTIRARQSWRVDPERTPSAGRSPLVRTSSGFLARRLR